MSSSTIYATYSGTWVHFGIGTWDRLPLYTAQDGANGGIGGLKLRHANAGQDYWDDLGIGFVQFDTSSIPANATITEALFNVSYTKNNFVIGGGVGMAISTMNWGAVYREGVDDYTSGNILNGNLQPNSGIVSFNIVTPNSNITKNGYSKFHISTANIISRVSPGAGAGVGDDDFNMAGTDASGTNRPKLIITYTTPPAVTTGAASTITDTTATLAGTVTDYGGGTVSSRGVCWATGANPTTANAKATTGSDAISVSATGLTKNTLYHYRAFITTENSTTYGADATFTTDTDPAVTTGAVTILRSVTATLGGNITSNGNSTVSTAGVCWALTSNPTTASAKTATATVLGAYTVGATGLIAGQLYHYRAYVTTSVSTQYGTDLTFRTVNGGNFIPFL